MAVVDVCSEASSSTSSPRISFSHDLQDSDDHIGPIEFSQRCLPDSFIDFDFCTAAHHHFFSQQISSADELFADGKILPVQIKEIPPPAKPRPRPPQTPPRISDASAADDNRKMLKEFLSTNIESEDDSPPPPPTAKHFWQFRRSSSLNCDNRRGGGGNGNGLVRSSLQFLSRSNSTGSAPNPTARPPRSAAATRRKQRSKSEPFSVSSLLFNGQINSTHSNPSYCSSKNNISQLKKSSSCRSSSRNGVRISPVLNISPTYISRNTFFGLGSLFCNGKSKKKKKR